MATQTWAMGDAFGLADCAAAPSLFYANEVLPFGDGYANVAAYLDRLKARPSYARVLKEAEPYFAMFPREAR
jgi:glutathione S-transferase